VSVLPVEHSSCTQLGWCELLRWKMNRGQEEHHCASSGWGTRQRRKVETYFQCLFTTVPRLLISTQNLLARIMEATERSQSQVNL